MKKILTILMILILGIGMVYAVDISGSTAANIMTGKDEYKEVWIEQDFDVDVNALHFDIIGNVNYDLGLEEEGWDYELGASYELEYFVFGGSLTGEKDIELNEIKGYVDFAIGDLGFNTTILLSADDLKDKFQGAEFYAFYKPEPIEITIGYLFTDDGAEVAGEAPNEPLDGGFYAKAKISY